MRRLTSVLVALTIGVAASIIQFSEAATNCNSAILFFSGNTNTIAAGANGYPPSTNPGGFGCAVDNNLGPTPVDTRWIVPASDFVLIQLRNYQLNRTLITSIKGTLDGPSFGYVNQDVRLNLSYVHSAFGFYETYFPIDPTGLGCLTISLKIPDDPYFPDIYYHIESNTYRSVAAVTPSC